MVQSRTSLRVGTRLASPPSPAPSDRTVTQVTVKGGSSASAPTKIIVVADLNCPWSFVALREINQAIRDIDRKLPRSTVRPKYDIEFRPFFLSSTVESSSSSEGQAYQEYYESRFGEEQYAEMTDVLRKRGREVGIKFKFNGKLRSTMRAHRLLYLAYARGGTAMQQALLELLYSGFFEEEKDITDVELLASYAAKIGLMPIKSGQAWLSSRASEEDVCKLAKISTDCGITGVPFAVVEGKWAISGGMDKAVYYKTLEKLVKGDMSK
jgi:predicted DsbA family dithiol-disulfide isomerase